MVKHCTQSEGSGIKTLFFLALSRIAVDSLSTLLQLASSIQTAYGQLNRRFSIDTKAQELAITTMVESGPHAKLSLTLATIS